MRTAEPAFYFSLPRLLWRWNGGNAARTEANWLETNVAGLLVHGIVYLFAFQLFLTGMPPLAQVLLALPLLAAVWVFWVIFFYATSLCIRAGLLRSLPRARAQSVMVGTLTTCFAFALAESGTWSRWIGLLWIAAVVLNLSAGALLALQSPDARRRR